ncbi:methionyl-tRNA formyltransferase [Flaviaesturariibacter terrae]
MPVLLLTNSRVSIPALHSLRDHFDAVFTPTPLSDDYAELTLSAAAAGLPLFALEPSLLFTAIRERLAADPDLVVVLFGFPLRVPADVLAGNNHRIYNVHFSLLPKYAGPLPLFWQLRAGDSAGGISIHQLTSCFDDGPIAAQQEVTLYPGETYGLYSARLEQAAVPLLRRLLDEHRAGKEPLLRPQDLRQRSFQRKPREKDLLIDWLTQPAASIEHLVNACNPIATGAWTWFKGQPLQLLEVSPADGRISAPPGTIVHADPGQGLFVCCCDDQLLRINVVKLPHSVLSGGKLAALGFRNRDRFENDPRRSPAIQPVSY